MDNASVKGLQLLGLLPKNGRRITIGEKYIAFNRVILDLSRHLDTDLWTVNLLLYILARYKG